jgi:hypothetical protein
MIVSDQTRETMADLKDLFERQAEWQRSRADLPWAEKLRLSLVMRKSLLALRESRHGKGSFHDRDAQSKYSHS